MTEKKITTEFYTEPPYINEIYWDNNKICSMSGMKFHAVSSLAVNHPAALFPVSGEATEDGLYMDALDLHKIVKASLQINNENDYIFMHFDVKQAEPVWMFEWTLTGLDFDEIIIPALGGQKLLSSMPDGEKLTFKYPFWWNAEFVIGQKGDSGILFCTRDASTKLKMLRVSREKGAFNITFGFEAKAPLESGKLSGFWFMVPFTGGWENAVDIHRAWAEKTLELKLLHEKTNFPEWADNINLVLEIWGAKSREREPHHTFREMEERIEEWKDYHDPSRTLLYLPGFAEDGIDTRAPDYNPSDQCGGEEDFKRLIKKAHALGYRVMVHTNTLAMTYHHPLYEEFKKYQVIDCFNRPMSWGTDIDGDWLAEPFFAYMNPGYEAWTNYFMEVIQGFIDKYNIDGVFLDQTLLAFNVSKGPDFIEGMKKHIDKINKRFPDLMIAGEGMNEHIASVLPAAQIHGIDSIANVHGLELEASWKQPHPVSAYYFGKYVRFFAHLLTKHPSSKEFARQEEIYGMLGVIPSVVLYDADQQMDMPEVRRMIERANNLNFRGIYEKT